MIVVVIERDDFDFGCDFGCDSYIGFKYYEMHSKLNVIIFIFDWGTNYY